MNTHRVGEAADGLRRLLAGRAVLVAAAMAAIASGRTFAEEAETSRPVGDDRISQVSRLTAEVPLPDERPIRQPPARGTPWPAGENGQTVRDKLWIFACVAGADNEGWNLPGPSRMTPAEGAYYLGVPNLMMIRWNDKPPIPFDQYAVALRPLKRVVWSLVGSGGKTAEEGRKHALALPARFPNVVGFIMDDFFHRDGSGRLPPEELKNLRAQLTIGGRKRDLYVVLYSRQLELPVDEHLKYCDKITLWTWRSEELDNLEENFRRLESLAPNHGKLLGCYMWDFGNKAPMPVDRMKKQCELGLRWLGEGRIEGMIFLANTVCDLELEAVEWTRKWIAEVGDTPVGD